MAEDKSEEWFAKHNRQKAVAWETNVWMEISTRLCQQFLKNNNSILVWIFCWLDYIIIIIIFIIIIIIIYYMICTVKVQVELGRKVHLFVMCVWFRHNTTVTQHYRWQGSETRTTELIFYNIVIGWIYLSRTFTFVIFHTSSILNMTNKRTM